MSRCKGAQAARTAILTVYDSMTPSAQQALRRTMEIYSATTRFALACNTSSRIIEPIQSRCALLRYTRLSDAQVLRRLIEVCAAEKATYTEDGLEALVYVAQGDMRQALNGLQSTVAGFGLVNADTVFKVCGEHHRGGDGRPLTDRLVLPCRCAISRTRWP